jgi:hypothetical protein
MLRVVEGSIHVLLLSFFVVLEMFFLILEDLKQNNLID